MGGMQDNGSWHGPAYTWTNGGIRNYYWNNVGGGDGFDVMPDAEDASWVYSESQGGALGKRNWKTGESWYIKPPSLDPKLLQRFNWNSPMAQDPFDPKTIYYGSQFVHKSTDKGSSWQTISPDLTTNDSVKIAAFQNTGGLTLDITGAETHCTILSIAPSKKEKGTLWIGTDDGNVQLTRDGGATWTNFQGKIPGLPAGCWIPQVVASPHNAAEAFVVANDYRRGDGKPYIFRTTDYGKTWKRMLDETKVKGYALCMIQDPAEPSLLFAGTEHGLWVSIDNGNNWAQWKNGYPSVSTYDLAIQEREADLVIATFGRSLWVLDDIRPLRKLAAATQTATASTSPLMVFESAGGVQAQYRPATGYEWSTWGLYEGENKNRGAAISFLIRPVATVAATSTTPAVTAAAKPVAARAGGRSGTDSVSVRIFNEAGVQIRSLRWAADSGFNRRYWGMEEKGYRQPGGGGEGGGGGRFGMGRGGSEPGGLPALPGTYKVVLKYGEHSDSTFVTVSDDPRLGNRNDVKQAQKKALEQIQKSAEKLSKAMDQLGEAEEVCNKMNAQLKGADPKATDSLSKLTKNMLDHIKKIREKISGPTEEKQGLSRNPFLVTVLSQLRSAQQSISAKSAVPGQAEATLMLNAETAVNAIVKEINEFFAGHWTAYKNYAEANRPPLFKEYKPID
jgi:hypothetical protein